MDSSLVLDFRKRVGELTQGVLNKSWQAVGDRVSSYLYSLHIARDLGRRTSVCAPCSSAAVALPLSSALSCRSFAPLRDGVAEFI
jgi:hypothetical protein